MVIMIPEKIERFFTGGEILAEGAEISYGEIHRILNVPRVKSRILSSEIQYSGGGVLKGNKISGIENGIENYRALFEGKHVIFHTECHMPESGKTFHYFQVSSPEIIADFFYEVDPNWVFHCGAKNRETCSCAGC